MNEEKRQRVIGTVEYFISTNGATVRSTGKAMGTSKTTVYQDITLNCAMIYGRDSEIMHKVANKLHENLLIRHIHGGEATRQKYLKLNKK